MSVIHMEYISLLRPIGHPLKWQTNCHFNLHQKRRWATVNSIRVRVVLPALKETVVHSLLKGPFVRGLPQLGPLVKKDPRLHL